MEAPEEIHLPHARKVFPLRNIHFRDVKAIGFDMDYTLSHYRSPEIDELAFTKAGLLLVREQGYPKWLLEQRFDPPGEADLARARLFSEAEGEPPRVRVGPTAAPWAVARPGVRLVSRTEKGGAVVELPGASAEWATRFALSLGGDAEVVAPAAARRHFAEAIRRTLERYA